MKKTKLDSVEVFTAASILYYDIEELTKFINMLKDSQRNESLIVDGMFLKFIDYVNSWKNVTEVKLEKENNELLNSVANNDVDGNSDPEMVLSYSEDSLHYILKNPDKRRQAIIDYVNQMNYMEPSSDFRENFELWFQSVVEKDVDLQLADEIIAKFIWQGYLDQINAMDKSSIPYSKRVTSIPRMPDGMRKDKVKKISDVTSKDLFPDSDGAGMQFTLGVPDFDSRLPFKKGEFCIIAARPGVGKTVVMMKMSMANALRDKKCMFISLEMPEKQMVNRFINFYAKRNIEGEFTDDMGNVDVVGARRVADKYMSENKYKRIFDNISYFDSSEKDAQSIIDFMEKEIEKESYDIIFIDYLQLMMYNGLNQWDSIRKATRDLKKFALRNNVLVISASQVSRESTERGLYLSDLFGGSTIEADTDRVIGLEENQAATERNLEISIINFKIMKNRHGPRFEEKKVFNYLTGQISDLDR